MCSVMNGGTDSVRVGNSEMKSRLLREGEVSPYKLILSLLMRELYLPVSISSGEQAASPSPETLLLIYKLITENDISYSELTEIIHDPTHNVRLEVLKRFEDIISNLDRGNVYFLYELAHSIISIESSQTVIFKKKIGKNSPFGKFLRSVYMNIRRMSYSQVDFVYNQLADYLNLKARRSHKSSSSIGSSGGVDPSKRPSNLQLNTAEKPTKGKKDLTTHKESITVSSKFPGLDLFQKLSDRFTEERKTDSKDRLGIGLDYFSQYVIEYGKMRGDIDKEEEAAYLKCLQEKNTRAEKGKVAIQSLRKLWKPSTVVENGPMGDISIWAPPDDDVLGRSKKRSTSRRSVHLTPTRVSLRSPRKTRSSPGMVATSFPQEFLIVEDGDDGYFLPDDEIPAMGASSFESKYFLTPTKSPAKSPRGKRKSVPSKEEESLITSAVLNDMDKEYTKTLLEVAPSGRWNNVKGWSRRQIERTVKNFAEDMYRTNSPVPSPRNISDFVEAILRNPCSQLLNPQIHFLEYLNGLRVKDLNRCSESLRTSFDIRIKPNTTELNKGTPYAAYNFALFYNLLGYRKDAMSSLEEAFRAGHAAGDSTCLHHCHNLWARFHGKPYTEAILTVTKEVDNNMAYLHSLNVIANAFDYHYQRFPTEEVLYTLWHYNAECDLEEMEALLLTSIGSLFTVFGWHEMTSFPCQMILNTRLKWPTRAYCFAICSLSQCLLFHGDVKVPFAIMDYAKQVFGLDASPAGELFTKEEATFKAMYAYLGYRPLDIDLISTIDAFDRTEALYWMAYNKVICCDWEEAGSILNKLWIDLTNSEMNYVTNDLKIRCLLMQAELECLCKSPAGALSYLSEALELSYSISSDIYVTLILSHIASIQCEMKLVASGSRTMHKDMRAAIRCSSPWLKCRLNVVNVKLTMRLQGTLPQANVVCLMKKLNWAEELYSRWDNHYRLKEIYHLKIELLDRSEDLGENGSIYRKKLNSLQSTLPFSPSTCLI